MISIFSITRIVGIIAVSYASVVAAIVALIWMFSETPTLWGSISIAFSGGTVLQFALLGAADHGWRWVWSKIPALNTAVFPDLNGAWKIKIDWQSPDDSDSVEGDAIIKQSLVRFSMEVAAPGSDSKTYAAVPKKDPESGTLTIYYMYNVTPKNIGKVDRSPYDGAAILKFSNTESGELSGNYFTSAYTKGHFHLTR
jgi:hypothetical protein